MGDDETLPWWEEPPPDDGGGVATEDPWEGWTDNGDGSYTNPYTGEIQDESGQFVGYENGDGTWTDTNGNVFNADGSDYTVTFDESFVLDPQSGLWYDKISGTWWNEDGTQETVFVPRDPPGGPVEPGSAEDLGNGTLPGDKGFFDNVGDFFKKLFTGDSASPAASNALQGRVNDAQQKVQQAQQQGASQQQLQQLQRQLQLAQAAQKTTQLSDTTKMILIAGAVGLGVYVLTQRRQSNPAPTRKNYGRRLRSRSVSRRNSRR